MFNIEYIKGEVWMPSSSWRLQRCIYSDKTIWPWQTAMKGINTQINGSRKPDGGGSQMWMETSTRWVTHEHYTLLKLSGKVS